MQLRIKFRFINFTAPVVVVYLAVVVFVVVVVVAVVQATRKLDSS